MIKQYVCKFNESNDKLLTSVCISPAQLTGHEQTPKRR